MNYRHFLTILLLAAVASGCGRREEADDSNADQAAPAAAEPAPSPVTAPKVVAPISVKVSLSPNAKAELAKSGETVEIEAIYVGDPTPESSSQSNEMGVIELGKKIEPANEHESATFDDSIIDTSRLSLVVGQPQVMINVRSAKKKLPSNILACPFYWESVAVASAGTVEIACMLLSEAPSH